MLKNSFKYFVIASVVLILILFVVQLTSTSATSNSDGGYCFVYTEDSEGQKVAVSNVFYTSLSSSERIKKARPYVGKEPFGFWGSFKTREEAEEAQEEYLDGLPKTIRIPDPLK